MDLVLDHWQTMDVVHVVFVEKQICKFCKASLKNKARVEARKAVNEAPAATEEAPAEEANA